MKFEDFPVPLRIEAHQISLSGTSSVHYKFLYTYREKTAEITTDHGRPIDNSGVIYAYCGVILLDDNLRAPVVIFGTPHFKSTVVPIEVHIVNDPTRHMQAILARAIEIAAIKRED